MTRASLRSSKENLITTIVIFDNNQQIKYHLHEGKIIDEDIDTTIKARKRSLKYRLPPPNLDHSVCIKPFKNDIKEDRIYPNEELAIRIDTKEDTAFLEAIPEEEYSKKDINLLLRDLDKIFNVMQCNA